MKSFSYMITDAAGIHARPAGLLVKEAKKYESNIFLNANGKRAEATKLMAIMTMGVKKGQEVTVEIEGGDEDATLVAVEDFFKNNL